MTLKQLAKDAEAAQAAAWAAWQAAFDVAQQARILAYELIPLEKVEEPPLTWNPIRDALKKPTTWRQAMGDDPA